VVLVCGCALGIGSETYAELVSACGGPEDFACKYSDPGNFAMDQWAVQSYFQALSRIGRVLVYSPALTDDQLKPFGVQKIHHLQEEVDKLLLRSPTCGCRTPGALRGGVNRLGSEELDPHDPCSSTCDETL